MGSKKERNSARVRFGFFPAIRGKSRNWLARIRILNHAFTAVLLKFSQTFAVPEGGPESIPTMPDPDFHLPNPPSPATGFVVPAPPRPAPALSPLEILRLARKTVILISGLTVLLVGIVMIVMPGPAFIVIPLGLGILATEFVWAQRLLHRVKQQAKAQLEKLARTSTPKNESFSALPSSATKLSAFPRGTFAYRCGTAPGREDAAPRTSPRAGASSSKE